MNFKDQNHCLIRRNKKNYSRIKCNRNSLYTFFNSSKIAKKFKQNRNSRIKYYLTKKKIYIFFFLRNEKYEFLQCLRGTSERIKTKQLVLLTKWIRVLNRLMANWKSVKDFDESLVLPPVDKNAIVDRTICVCNNNKILTADFPSLSHRTQSRDTKCVYTLKILTTTCKRHEQNVTFRIEFSIPTQQCPSCIQYKRIPTRNNIRSHCCIRNCFDPTKKWDVLAPTTTTTTVTTTNTTTIVPSLPYPSSIHGKSVVRDSCIHTSTSA